MSDNKFTLHKSKNPTDEGWHQISGAINSDQILEIADTEGRKAKADLSITKWNRENEIRALLNSPHPNQQLLGRTLQLFLEQEGSNSEFSNVKDIYLIRYNHQLIGGSSPLTLFFTHPDLKP